MKKPTTTIGEYLALKNPRAAELYLAHQARCKETAAKKAALAKEEEASK